MVRSDQQLIERMALIWHSWFATSIEASNAALMIRQNKTMRAHALGNFHELLVNVTRDPAMLLWLSGTSNTKYSPNENYGREVMELFTLGADRGAYTQQDVHGQARALTGFTNDWSGTGPTTSGSIPSFTIPGSRPSSAIAAISTTGTRVGCASSIRCTLRSWSRSCGAISWAHRPLRASGGPSRRPT